MYPTLKSLLTVGTLAALLCATVESYTCAQCSFFECDSQSLKTCESSEGCFGSKQALNMSGMPVALSQDKGCAVGKCIPLAFSASLGDGRTFGYEQRCCQSDQCNRDKIYLPQNSAESNGVKCPACFNEGGTSCSPEDLPCTGAETKCVKVTGTAVVNPTPDKSLFAMGCATANTCDLKSIVVLHGVRLQIHCTNSGATPPASVLTSVLGGLFLLKVLL